MHDSRRLMRSPIQRLDRITLVRALDAEIIELPMQQVSFVTFCDLIADVSTIR